MSKYPLMASLLGASPSKRKKKPKIVGLYTAKESGAPMRSHRKVQLVEGLGIAGDRYAHLAGSYSAFRRSLRERAPSAHRAGTVQKNKPTTAEGATAETNTIRRRRAPKRRSSRS